MIFGDNNINVIIFIFLFPVLIVMAFMSKFNSTESVTLLIVLLITLLVIALVIYYDFNKPIETTRVSLDMDYQVYMKDNNAFIKSFKRDMAAQLGVNEEDIIVHDVTPGSININFEIKSNTNVNINNIKTFPNLEKTVGRPVIIKSVKSSTTTKYEKLYGKTTEVINEGTLTPQTVNASEAIVKAENAKEIAKIEYMRKSAAAQLAQQEAELAQEQANIIMTRYNSRSNVNIQSSSNDNDLQMLKAQLNKARREADNSKEKADNAQAEVEKSKKKTDEAQKTLDNLRTEYSNNNNQGSASVGGTTAGSADTGSADTGSATITNAGTDCDKYAGASEWAGAGYTKVGEICGMCPPNSTSSNNGYGPCVPKAGYELGNNTYNLCPVGKFKANAGSGDCTECHEGSNTNGQLGSTSCVANAGWQHTGEHDFEKCPENTYKSGVGNDLCSPCDVGSSTNGQTGLTSCVANAGWQQNGEHGFEQCADGYFKASIGDDDCTQCTGDFVPNPDKTACVCPTGSILQNNECIAVPGYIMVSGDNGNTFEKCPVNTYKSSTSGADCTPCPDGEFSIAGSTSADDCGQSQCIQGMYGAVGAPASGCVNCPVGQTTWGCGAVNEDQCITESQVNVFNNPQCEGFTQEEWENQLIPVCESGQEICYENSNSGLDTDCSACYPENAREYILNTMLTNNKDGWNRRAYKDYVDKIDTHWGYISKLNSHDIVDTKTWGSEQQQCERDETCTTRIFKAPKKQYGPTHWGTPTPGEKNCPIGWLDINIIGRDNMPKALENLYDDNCFACPDGYTTKSDKGNVVQWRAIDGPGALDYITVSNCPMTAQGGQPGGSLTTPGGSPGSGCGICVPK